MEANIPWRIVGQFDNLTIEDAKENRIALVACYDTAIPNYERSQERAALIIRAVNSHEAAQRLAEAVEQAAELRAAFSEGTVTREILDGLYAALAEFQEVTK